MREIHVEHLELIAGGLDLSRNPLSENVIDLRGMDMGVWGIDANGMCWAPGTPSIKMFPQGADASGVDYAGSANA